MSPLWVFLLVYAVIGFGGTACFHYFVQDGAWRETFNMSWWLPSMLLAALVLRFLPARR